MHLGYIINAYHYYSREIWHFCGMPFNCQSKICQNFYHMLHDACTYGDTVPYCLHVVWGHLMSANISGCTVKDKYKYKPTIIIIVSGFSTSVNHWPAKQPFFTLPGATVKCANGLVRVDMACLQWWMWLNTVTKLVYPRFKYIVYCFFRDTCRCMHVYDTLVFYS